MNQGFPSESITVVVAPGNRRNVFRDIDRPALQWRQWEQSQTTCPQVVADAGGRCVSTERESKRAKHVEEARGSCLFWDGSRCERESATEIGIASIDQADKRSNI